LRPAIEAFQEFVDRLEEADSAESLQRITSRVLQDLQLPTFAYIGYSSMPEAATPLIVATYPVGWAARYYEQNYLRDDAVLKTANAELLPFDWGSQDYLSRLALRPRQIFNEAGEFGIRRGFTVPIHDSRGKVATLNVATDEPYRSFSKNIAENRHLLHLIGIYLHAHVRHQLQRSAIPGDPRLSPREIECLQWAARGKSSHDISDILGISQRTVVFHVENAKAKFGVRTLQQAIVEGVIRRIIWR
jgi:LuxR family transcriptional regulator, activator of conjugal transfer of Ti plasmids